MATPLLSGAKGSFSSISFLTVLVLTGCLLLFYFPAIGQLPYRAVTHARIGREEVHLGHHGELGYELHRTERRVQDLDVERIHHVVIHM